MRSLNASISESSNSRARCRYLASRAGVGLMAAVSGGSTLAQEGKDMITAELTDPKSKRTPFKRQSQPWPGLASKMEPQPDHGEKTYRGLGRSIFQEPRRLGIVSELPRAGRERAPSDA